ncbi:MAG: AtzE family amidohydrolase [Alphaproteobacteria bacterium]|nr:AtzE family amidohydrolase [Alphaproteobacteria bacterium]MBU0795432.1 AtzE family amidohydrolase [Alphaproteobacteria bacterium]MBU0876613.1 AtzE family amidohydrolase [Alphaproteobacteria bacterium]MBU1769314.1 AtzE family amidohydrolase [Alphaproteobacteria bacterium]
MTDWFAGKDIRAIAASVRSGECSARAIAQTALARIADGDAAINAVTRTLPERALAEADRIDAQVAEGIDPGPLAGVPYGVKDLFDVSGLPTTAGAGRLRQAAPARDDAEAIARLSAAGAVLVATLNMDEFAYGFVTDNAHWGQTRNPHDTQRFAGGSSGGSAAAVAAGFVSFALGSDTNGSIRIPASLCGLHGIKPTHGSLPMEGVYPFVHTLDDIGAFTRSAADLAAVDGVLRGPAADAAPSTMRPARLGGWFAANLAPQMRAALDALSADLGDLPVVDLPDVSRARSAAFLITAFEGGQLHKDALRTDALSFDPATRDRLIAGAALPRSVYEEALAFRAVFAAHVDRAFAEHDVLIAPAVFGPAPLIDDPVIPIDGVPQPARANLGLYTQPLSYLGLPIIAAPLAVEGLPLGVQLIAAKGRDRALLDFAVHLEARGLTAGRLAIRSPLS